MNTLICKINNIINNKFLIAFSFFIFIFPPGIAKMEIVISHFYIVRILLLILIILMLIKYIPNLLKEKKISPMIIVGVIYCFGRFLVTYIKTNNFIACAMTYSLPLVCVILIFVETHIKDNTLNFIEGLLIYSELLIYINAICLLNPSFGNIFYCGSPMQGDNNHLVYYILGLASSYIYYYLKKDKISKYRMIILWITIIICTLYSWSATAVVSLTAFFFALLVSYKLKIANIISYTIIYYISFFGIVIFRLQNLFSFIIVDILHKSLTLSLRTNVWDNYLNAIAKSPIIGYGYNAPHLYEEIQKLYLYAHNHILQEIYNGGIIMYFIYCFFVILPIIKLWKNRDNKLSKVLSAIIFAILISSIAESLSEFIFILIYALSYNIDFLINHKCPVCK